MPWEWVGMVSKRQNQGAEVRREGDRYRTGPKQPMPTAVMVSAVFHK